MKRLEVKYAFTSFPFVSSNEQKMTSSFSTLFSLST